MWVSLHLTIISANFITIGSVMLSDTRLKFLQNTAKEIGIIKLRQYKVRPLCMKGNCSYLVGRPESFDVIGQNLVRYVSVLQASNSVT